jgi:hypothetical protein
METHVLERDDRSGGLHSHSNCQVGMLLAFYPLHITFRRRIEVFGYSASIIFEQYYGHYNYYGMKC